MGNTQRREYPTTGMPNRKVGYSGQDVMLSMGVGSCVLSL